MDATNPVLSTEAVESASCWPPKRQLFGVGVSVTNYEEATRAIVRAALAGRSALVDLMPVHVLVTAAGDRAHRTRWNAFDIVAPDGQPVRWALNLLHRAGLADRVYGPELTLRLCQAAEQQGAGIYLYGSTPDVLQKLRAKLLARFPRLQICGWHSPPFRPLSAEEDEADVQRINQSGAQLIFLGTGSPRQEIFAYEHRHRIHGVQVCVGAAFDFHAGTKKMAPRWMQRMALEWLFRLVQEPRRLWRRYLTANSAFLFLLACALLGGPGRGGSRGLPRHRRARPGSRPGEAGGQSAEHGGRSHTSVLGQ